ncbi:MAG TPA: transcriptional regulator [Rhodocyclaceae bacterium]|uniref:transcriptional regulator n=1 Tax=Zoogloea sp. TaxID=49181 RepID=UPI002C9155B8|nr:transcriptional regulator [Zoogloea sp.]HMV63771.1 transcriptional regulator [Rhodocyclaceae bacterium]HMW52388.1 transcriptional regulator [Rhodocyclaceae bacterium]HNA67716.1 transcriptional regulator [Rhodocyclaceae bacterium]HNB64276.1 transcriptional regulator [Rhodocyclaceae bacterium]HNC80703.1 transcriptional regulator [Rhodocyclaceae bacterium]
METLDPLLHQPLRTQLAAFLAGAGEASFSELKRGLQVSDGNLESHLKKLVAAGYVSVARDTGPGRPQTRYALTAEGSEALRTYVQTLQRLLPLAEPNLPDTAGGTLADA